MKKRILMVVAYDGTAYHGWQIQPNGITIESVPQFQKVTIPVIALAGEKEQEEIRDGVKKLSEVNPNCRCEIWEKAGHNIPPMFAKRFNALIRSVCEAEKGSSD